MGRRSVMSTIETNDLALVGSAFGHYRACETVTDEEILAFLAATEDTVAVLQLLGPCYEHGLVDLMAIRRRFDGWRVARGL